MLALRVVRLSCMLICNLTSPIINQECFSSNLYALKPGIVPQWDSGGRHLVALPVLWWCHIVTTAAELSWKERTPLMFPD